MLRRIAVILTIALTMTSCDGTYTISSHMSHKTTLSDKPSILAMSQAEVASDTPPLDVPLINQMDEPRIYNGCEVTSMAMILRYLGYDVTKMELAEKIPRVPLTYDNGLKGNPNEGFVGDMENGPGLSVYHGPMYDVAKSYAGDKAIDITGGSPEDIYQYVAQGLPVWIITTTHMVPVNEFETWKTPSGTIEVTFNVHSVVVTGFDKTHVYVNDPYGDKNKQVDRQAFEAAWKQMGSQAIVIEK